MSRSLSRLQAILLGLAVIAGLGVTAVGLFAIGQRQWLLNDSFQVRVNFPQIHGVEAGTRVRVLGREAGEVDAVELPDNPSGQVTLCLRIDGKLRNLVRSDASAQIVNEGMVGSKVVEIHPGSDEANPVQDGALISCRPTTELTDVLSQVSTTLQNIGQVSTMLQNIGKGDGSIGRLVKEDDAYQELVKLLRQGRGTMVALKQNADAIKGMPLVRNYIQDPFKELVRPDCEKDRRWFHEADLFEPGRAVLTEGGRRVLDDLVPWLDGLKIKGSEIVVASFAVPTMDYDLAHTLTQKQSETVREYLVSHHSIQKLGWFSRRKVTPIGCGIEPCPVPEKETLPYPRTEVIVFLPQS